MNFNQRPVDELTHLSFVPEFDTGQNLGQWAAAAMMAYEAYQENQDEGGTSTDQSKECPEAAPTIQACRANRPD